MNRIIFRDAETDGATVEFRGDDRARHALDVLHAVPGSTVKLGRLGGERYDSATVLETDAAATRVRLALGEATPPLSRPGIDLLLAVPRPKCMRRLWPQLSALGVGRIYLTAAEKVEKDYWGSSFLKPEVYEPLIVDGLMQSGDTIPPEVEIHRRLKPLLEDVLAQRYAGGRAVFFHPCDARADATPAPGADAPLLLAIGPEGGWSDYECAMFDRLGFVRRSLGPRILRTDTAVVAAISSVTAV